MDKKEYLIQRKKECFKQILSSFKKGYTYEPSEAVVKKDKLKTFLDKCERTEEREINCLTDSEKILIEGDIYYYKILSIQEKMYRVIRYLTSGDRRNIEVLERYLKIFEEDFGLK